MRLFLDDVRNPTQCVSYMWRRIGPANLLYLEEWTVVRNYRDFIKAVDDFKGQITHVSFDHDLAEAHYHETMDEGGTVYMKYLETISEKTGMDCAKYLKEVYKQCGIPLPKMFVHSQNPVGTENIINLFK